MIVNLKIGGAFSMNLHLWLPIIVIAVVVLFFTISLFIKNKKANYDERQLLARNSAYKCSFFFLMVYCLVCGLLHLFQVEWSDLAVQLFLGIILSFTLFIAISILKDAYFSNSRKQNTQSVISFFSSGIVSILYLLVGIGRGDALWVNGELSILVLYLIASVCTIGLGILSLIKMNLEKRGA